MSDPELDWSTVIDVLADMQARGIISNYAVGGAMAGVLYDEPISTADLDLFFFFSEPQTGLVLSLEKIYDYARKKGFAFDHEFIHIQGWLVQFIEATRDPLWKEAVEQAKVFVIDGRDVPVIRPEYLAVMWMQAGRKKDIRKIETFDEGKVMERAKLEKILSRFGMMNEWKANQNTFSRDYQF